MKRLSFVAALTLSTMLSACGGGGGGHSFIPPSTLPDNPDNPSVTCEGVTCMTNDGLSNKAKRNELYKKAFGTTTYSLQRARTDTTAEIPEQDINHAYETMHTALTGTSLNTSDPNLRQNLILAGFEDYLPETDAELQEWAKKRQYMIKRHAEKMYNMYGTEQAVYLDNAKLHLVEETANQDSFINFTIDENTHDINGIEIANNDFGAEAVTDKLNYDGFDKSSDGGKFSGSNKLHTYNFYYNDQMGTNGPRLYIEISGYDENGNDEKGNKLSLDFIKEKLQLKLQERAAEDLAGGETWLDDNLSIISDKIDKINESDLQNTDMFKHMIIDRDLDITYTSYAKKIGGIEGNNLLYSDFGLLDVKENRSDSIALIEKTQVFAGGYDANKINPTGKMTFTGDAVGGVNYKKSVIGDNGIVDTKTMQLKDGKAILDFENGKETLTATFSNWYDVTATKENGKGNISFTNGDKIADSTFKFKGPQNDLFDGLKDNGPQNLAGHDTYTNTNFIGEDWDMENTADRLASLEGYAGAMDMGYYGKDGNISEATGYVMYNEDNLNGEKLQDVLKTPEAIEEFKKANELDDAEFDNLKNAALMEVLQMQIGVGMQKK